MYKEVKFNKYNAKSTQYNGRSYHSKLEASYAERLDWLLKAGEIKEWIPQFKIDLKVNGKHIANYYMDFKVIDKYGAVQFHEVKGMETDVWKIKWLILQATINEIEPGAEMILIKELSSYKRKF
jgi:hypothetical protein